MHTVHAPMEHAGSPRLFPTPASCLFTLHPSVGAIMCPPLIPAQPHALSKTTFIPQCTCIPHVSNSPTMPSVCRPTPPWVPVRADHCHLSLFSFYLLPTLVTHTLFILWLRTQFKSPFSISHTPHNGFLLIYWSVLFMTHQGTITQQ